MKTMKAIHKSTGHIYNVEIYATMVYLIDEMRTISFEDFKAYFEVITNNK